MKVEALSTKQLIAAQKESIDSIFGVEAPNPPDKLFQIAEKLIETDLFRAEPFYLPKLRITENLEIHGWKNIDPWFYQQIREGTIDKEATHLPGEWILLDITKRPSTTRKIGGRDSNEDFFHTPLDDDNPMYPDREGFKDILGKLRTEGKITVPDFYKDIPKDSRYGLSFQEIDGQDGFVAKEVARVLGLSKDLVSTPSYVAFNLIGNIALPHLGEANTTEWLNTRYDQIHIIGGRSDLGGLSRVSNYIGTGRDHTIGFRLQISFPASGK